MAPLSNATVSTRTLKGALAGAVAAGVWAFQQPLDKLVLRSRYDDVELLGRAVRPGAGWYRVGLLSTSRTGHCSGRSMPTWRRASRSRRPCGARRRARRALLPLAPHRLTDRFHPARPSCPPRGNRRAFAQAIWRHLLFGCVLGGLNAG